MPPEEFTKPVTSQAGPADGESSSGPSRRRSGRGHRGGRGRRRKQKRPQTGREPASETSTTETDHVPDTNESESATEMMSSPLEQGEDELPRPETEQPAQADEPAEALQPAEPAGAIQQNRPQPPPSQPASPITIQMAIEEVNRIVDTLRETLDDMEEVLEMLEIFERQSNADEREIESLRRSLRHLHRPRESGHSHRGH